MYVRFRTFQVKVSELDNSMVDTARNLAITDLAVAIAQMAVAIAGGFETFGAGAFAIATGVAAIAMASYSLEEAVAAIPPAAQDLADAHSMKNASDNFKAQTNADLVTAVARMKAADAKGILP
jgi:phosphoribosylformimino-5-aminoimidazole carboxamide ribonucleotide (ProFAR) isomerase